LASTALASSATCHWLHCPLCSALAMYNVAREI